MQQVFDKLSYLVGDTETLERMESVPALPLFSDAALDFLDCLSKRLMHSAGARRFPDVFAYAFWIRRESMEKACVPYKTEARRLGRGVAFHVTPSNIPVQFAVSMTYALIAGNASIIRVSSKEFEQMDIICAAIRETLRAEHPELAPYLCIVRYDHDEAVTQALSERCDIRLIWGGDHTVAEIRKAAVRPRCIDLGFADRYSLAVIDAEGYLQKDAEIMATDFYNDTYFSDQNACSSPRMVVWTGKNVPQARERFWRALAELVSKKYRMDPISSSEKLLKTAVCAAKHPGIREIKNDNELVRIELPELYDDIMTYKGSCGYFFEYHAKELREVVPLLKRECQTITYVGDIDGALRQLVVDNGVRGVDRIVPMGHGADISFVWDGVDLPKALSREIGAT